MRAPRVVATLTLLDGSGVTLSACHPSLRADPHVFRDDGTYYYAATEQ